ncbi:MAG: hypothetical protein CM1200mP41_04600 [Gammaproteobacteria bacterium]|nr:MAG: hypothetical protein CM1200mP41_04600 [Gammaproteobacteria bacterium]
MARLCCNRSHDPGFSPSADYAWGVCAYFNWDARRNAKLLPVSSTKSWEYWLENVADPHRVGLVHYRPGQALPECNVFPRFGGKFQVGKHAAACALWGLTRVQCSHQLHAVWS